MGEKRLHGNNGTLLHPNTAAVLRREEPRAESHHDSTHGMVMHVCFPWHLFIY